MPAYEDKALALRQCEVDGRPQWLKPAREIDNLLLLGNVKDPSTTNGELLPRLPYINVDGVALSWMLAAHLGQVGMYIRPLRTSDETWIFGPEHGSPEGIYTITLHHTGDSACAEYEHALASRNRYNPNWNRQRDSALPNICLSYSYAGPLSITNFTYVDIYYFDQHAMLAKYQRDVEELRRGPSDITARSIFYAFEDATPKCFSGSGAPIFTLLDRSQPVKGR